MSCANCGASLPADSQLCPACGARSQSTDQTTRRAPFSSAGITQQHVGAPLRTSGMAKASAILGVLGFCIPVVAGMAAVVTGHVARAEVKKSKGAIGGGNLALAGLFLGYGSTLLMCLVGSLLLSFGVNEAKSKITAPVVVPAKTDDDYVPTTDQGDEDVVAEDTVTGTRLELTPNGMNVDGAAVMEVGLITGHASLGELPALLGKLRQSRKDTAVLRIAADHRVRFGLLHRVMQTAQSATYRSLYLKAVDSDDSDAQPIWDGQSDLGLPPQEPVKLRVGARDLLLQRPGQTPVSIRVSRDAQGVANHDPLEKALIVVTQALPEQQTITLQVSDDVRTSDLLGVLEACAFAGLPYAALNSAEGT
ncbi:MAG: DUF4190 domain-containing protein [Myxococcaceae bacterium]